MPKDAKGHGSNARGTLNRLGIAVGGDYHHLHSSKADALAKEARKVGYRKPATASGSTGRYFHDYLQRQAAKEPLDDPGAAAKLREGSGSKSDAVPAHDGTVGRHGYNPTSVNEAIAAQNRSGRGKIASKEASMIHRLLRGRG